MRTEHLFEIGAASILSVRFCANKTGFIPTSSFPTDRFKAVLLLQFFFVCASVVLYVRLCRPYLFLISPSFGVSGGLCFVVHFLGIFTYTFD